MADAPLIHIGYHKCGSTWLQRTLFQSSGLRNALPRTEIAREFISVNQFDFDPHDAAARCRSAIAGVLESQAVPVLSHERLSGTPHGGGYDSRAIADRLAATFPDARILIVIREQRRLLTSIYKQYVRLGGAMTFEQYTRDADSGTVRMPSFRADFLEFHRLIAYYQAAFSNDRVLVLPLEQLATNPDAFVAAISRHVQIPPLESQSAAPANAAMSAAAATIRRPLNTLVRGPVNPSAPLDGRNLGGRVQRIADLMAGVLPPGIRARAEARLDRQVEQFVGDRYATSNARTAACTDLDLERWGYPISRASGT